jgi:GMP synthase (glutamine-hydrolysing)
VGRFLVLQLRPETEASDDEFAAFLRQGGLTEAETHRVRLDQGGLPVGLRLEDYAGVIVGGGPGCVSDAPEDKDPVEAEIEAACLGLMPEIIARDMPFMGCCYGIGILAHHLGAEVSKRQYSEPVGPVECRVTEAGATDPLLDGLEPEFTALVGHKEAVQELPAGAQHLVTSAPCPFQMIRAGRNVYATQFHPEADGNVFETRIRVYKNRGYFAPDDAERLAAEAHAARVHVPPEILARFVDRYR